MWETVGIERGVKLEEVHQRIDLGRDALAVPADQLRHGRDIFGDRPVRKQAMALNGIAYLAAQFEAGYRADILSVDPDHAGGWLHQPVYHAQQGGFSRPRGADDDGDGARRYR
ncbi:hypothetical protein D3C87_1018070 [compost metagenome]